MVHSDLSDAGLLADAFRGCDAIAHCAGINFEIAGQTYERILVEGTRNVIPAAKEAGVDKVLMLNFLRARPGCGSPYHESKFEAEQLPRQSGLDYTILKAGMIYGRGDQMLDHLSHTLFTIPIFATGGFRERPIRPVAVSEAVHIITAALTEGRLSCPPRSFLHRLLAAVYERTMRIPLVARQAQMLAEGFLEPSPATDALPADLQPRLCFTEDQIRDGLSDPGPFTRSDLHFSACPHYR